jgi:hypothetical protein
MDRDDEQNSRHSRHGDLPTANDGKAAMDAADGMDAVSDDGGAATDAEAIPEAGKPEPWDRLEHALAEQLTGGPLQDDPDSERKLRDRISPRYEIRIQTELDPIVEETKQYRKLAKEIDGRYDRFDS